MSSARSAISVRIPSATLCAPFCAAKMALLRSERWVGSGAKGHGDGLKEEAHFNEPRGLAWDPVERLLWVADSGNHCIRTVTHRG